MVRVSRRAAETLRSGHVWVYRSELAAGAEAAEPGALVTVEDAAGRALGTALYSSSSQIALRLVSQTPGLTRAEYLADLRARVVSAIARRRAVAPLCEEPEAETTAQRLLFSEADAVPGIVADRYGELVVVQLLTQGTAQDDVRTVLAEALRVALWEGAERLTVPRVERLTIWERPDGRIRELEQLAASPEEPLLHVGEGEPAMAATFALHGLRFGYDVGAGQKTGAFLDQRLNYQAAADWVKQSGRTGHVLDVCTYQGGFALHLARVCERVTGVDQSRAALEAADRNLERNAALQGVVDWIEADAFELLRALDEAGRGGKGRPAGLPGQFDTVVLDPPAFAKSKRAAEGAMRGYKELNLRAMRLLTPGGTLVTCSCSHHVSLEAFTAVLASAAADPGRRVAVFVTRGAAPDHPEVLTLPETRYLKCLICRVE